MPNMARDVHSLKAPIAHLMLPLNWWPHVLSVARAVEGICVLCIRNGFNF